MYGSLGAAITEYHKEGLKIMDLFSHSSRGQQLEVRMLTGCDPSPRSWRRSFQPLQLLGAPGILGLWPHHSSTCILLYGLLPKALNKHLCHWVGLLDIIQGAILALR